MYNAFQHIRMTRVDQRGKTHFYDIVIVGYADELRIRTEFGILGRNTQVGSVGRVGINYVSALLAEVGFDNAVCALTYHANAMVSKKASAGFAVATERTTFDAVTLMADIKDEYAHTLVAQNAVFAIELNTRSAAFNRLIH